VALGGGCFFNRILKDAIVSQLEAAGLNVLQTRSLSCGDAGLALGQAWVAARMSVAGNNIFLEMDSNMPEKHHKRHAATSCLTGCGWSTYDAAI